MFDRFKERKGPTSLGSFPNENDADFYHDDEMNIVVVVVVVVVIVVVVYADVKSPISKVRIRTK